MRSVLTRATAAIDRGVVRLMEMRMAPRTPKIDDRDSRTDLIDIARVYSAGTLGSPSRFFPEPELPQVALTPLGDGPHDTQVVDLTYTANYQPFHPDAREAYLAHPENQVAHARWWTSDRGRPTIVMIHGWGGGNHWVTARAFQIPYWLKHGYDVVSYVLPYHGDRAPSVRGPVQSGALFPTPNPLRTNEAFGHAIYDLRALAMFLRARGSEHVGVMGMSLGGYTTSLWASIAGTGDVGGVDFAVAMIPAVSFGHLMWKLGEDSPQRKQAIKAGITQDLLVDAFAVHSPLTRAPRVTADRLFVIAGRGDRITGPEQAQELADHWKREVLWFDGGHLAQVGRGDAMRTVRRGLSELGMPGRNFRG
jgi:pimeloyl-ACP methyl ester carboxylesterase